MVQISVPLVLICESRISVSVRAHLVQLSASFNGVEILNLRLDLKPCE